MGLQKKGYTGHDKNGVNKYYDNNFCFNNLYYLFLKWLKTEGPTGRRKKESNIIAQTTFVEDNACQLNYSWDLHIIDSAFIISTAALLRHQWIQNLGRHIRQTSFKQSLAISMQDSQMCILAKLIPCHFYKSDCMTATTLPSGWNITYRISRTMA